MKKSGRPLLYKKSRIISLRLEEDLYQLIKEIAALESTYSGKKVTEQSLCRNALEFCYQDGERLREVFRRARANLTKRIPRN
jgi:hypothetical protein